MSKNKIFWTVLISVVVIAALVAGGYALYRWGYVRGLAVDAGELFRSRFSGELGEDLVPWMHRGGMRGIGFYGHSMPFFWGGGLIALLMGGGILALAVYGVISLVRRNPASGEELEAKAK